LVAGLVSPDAAERRFTFSSQASQGLLQVVAIVTKAATEIGFLDSSYEFCEQLNHGESRRTTLRMARECRRLCARRGRSGKLWVLAKAGTKLQFLASAANLMTAVRISWGAPG
jgi:hypothetical protein